MPETNTDIREKIFEIDSHAKTAGGIVKLANIVLLSWSIIGFLVAIAQGLIWTMVGYGLFFTANIIYILSSLYSPRQEKRTVMEFMGKACAVWWPRFFPHWAPRGFFKLKADTGMWKKAIPILKPEEFKEGIDLAGGTAIHPNGGELWVVPIDTEEAILRRVYAAKDGKFEGFLAVAASTIVRTYLNSLDVDQVLQHQGGGFDLANTMGGDTTVAENTMSSPHQAIEELREEAEKFGHKLDSIFVQDYGIPDEVIKARLMAKKAELAKRSAKSIAEKEAIELSHKVGGITDILQEEYHYSRREAKEKAQSLVKFFKAADTRTLIDLQGGGSGTSSLDLASLVAQVVRVIGMTSKGGKDDKEGKEGKEGKEKEREEASEAKNEGDQDSNG